MKKKMLGAAAVAATFALALTGCTTDSGSTDGSGDDLIAINVGYIDTSINGVGIIAVANDQDLWTEAGLDVNLVPFTNGPTQIQAMASGSLDVGYIGGGAMWMPASGQGTVITPNESTFGDYLIASPESGATDMADLKGLKIGVPDGGSGEMILALALEEAGLTEADIERIPLDPPSVVSAFVAGQIDVAAIFSPLSDQIFESVPDAEIIANNRDFPETEFLGAWVASNDAAADKSEALTRFLEVWIQANDYRISDTEDTVALSAALSGAPADQLQSQADGLEWWTSDQILADNADGSTFERFGAFTQLFVEVGRLTTDEASAPEDFINIDLFAAAKDNLK